MTKIVVLEKFKKNWDIGSVVSVKEGYARNYLFPNNMALRENKKNIEHYDKIKDEIKIKEEAKLTDARKLLEEIRKIKIHFSREADEKDQLYGSISKKEIIDYLSNNNLKVKSDDLVLKNQIKSIGEHTIEINPYENIVEEFLIQVNKN